MDILKRELAPITDAAWNEIQKEAARTLKSNLSARKVVDVAGPKGLNFAAASLGRLQVNDQSADGVRYGIYRVQPLIELRVTFEMDVWELDNAERGANDIDLDPVIDAARRIAGFEEKAVYKGFKPGGIIGMSERASNESILLGSDASQYPDLITRAELEMKNRQVEGPYALVLGPVPYRILYGSFTGFPARKQVEEISGGEAILSPFIDGGFLVSQRGGDFELTIGQDFSLGYEAHEGRKARLYLSESFTFRILNPDAVVRLAPEPVQNGGGNGGERKSKIEARS